MTSIATGRIAKIIALKTSYFNRLCIEIKKDLESAKSHVECPVSWKP